MAQLQVSDPTAGQWPEISNIRPLKNRETEIRLLRSEPHTSDGALRFTTHHVELHVAEFAAVSYAWGAPVPKSSLKPIIIDEEVCLVRPVLHSFLEHARLHHIESDLWIDALCINQNDSEERNRQVALMGYIFSTATRVYAWLGRGDNDTNYAFEHLGIVEPQTPFIQHVYAQCIEKVFEMQYWKRRWVIQEFGLAKDIKLLCGPFMVSWDEIVENMNVENIILSARAKEAFDQFKQAPLLARSRSEDLLQLMLRYESLECIDKRDRAYTLRYIAKGGLELRPDYNEPVGEVFFRLLSLQTVSNVLPRMTGYLWPCRSAYQFSNCLKVSQQDMTYALVDKPYDRIFAVFEYVGTVSSVRSTSQTAAEHFNLNHICVSGPSQTSFCQFEFSRYYTHHVASKLGFWDKRGFESYSEPYYSEEPNPICKMQFISRGNVNMGDLVYRLPTSENKQSNVLIAFQPDIEVLCISGVLYNSDSMRSDAHDSITKFTKRMDQILSTGVTRCSRNMSTTFWKTRILCHISRVAMILLEMLDAQSHAPILQYDLEQDDIGQTDRPKPRCNCQSNTNVYLSEVYSNETSSGYSLDILSFASASSSAKLERRMSDRPTWLRTKEQRDLRNVEPSLDWLTHGHRSRLLGDSEMIQAAADGSISWLEHFLQQRRLDIDKSDRDGRTALSWAASYGNLQVVKLLVTSGRVNVNSMDKQGRTPVTWAVCRGKVKVIEFLITRAEVDLNLKGSKLPLQQAVQDNNLPIVKMLLDSNKTAPDELGKDRETALMWASRTNLVEIVKCLLASQRVDCNRQGILNRTPIMRAIEYNHLECFHLLLDAPFLDINVKDKSGWTLSRHAQLGGNKRILEALYDRGILDRKPF